MKLDVPRHPLLNEDPACAELQQTRMLLPVCLSPLLSVPPLHTNPFPRLLSTSHHPIPFENPNLPSPQPLPALLSSSSGDCCGERSRRRTVPCCSPMSASSIEDRVLLLYCLSYERAFWVLRSLITWNTGKRCCLCIPFRQLGCQIAPDRSWSRRL